MVLEDNFNGIDRNTWNFEIQRGGFGSGTFEWTTDDPKNAYTDAEGLHIVPTLTTESTDITKAQLLDNFVLNLTTSKVCTTKGIDECSIRSNKTAGTIINPVRSARLSTKGKKSIRYGRVEVVAKMPQGNWLWPAICKSILIQRGWKPKPLVLYQTALVLTVTRDDARRQ